MPTVDPEQPTVNVVFNSLGSMSDDEARAVSEWLRGVAEEILDADFRSQVDDDFAARYYRVPLDSTTQAG